MDQLTSRLSDGAKKYKEALAAMLKHQESFAKTLLEVYEPITGKFPSADNLSGSEGMLYSPTKKNRPNTPEKSLLRAQQFQRITKEASEQVLPLLDVVIERRIIQPTQDYLSLHKKIAKLVVKRDHKKIDYDRNKESLKKVKEKSSSGHREDERKTMKAEAALDEAFGEFDKVNGLLKRELPIYIQLRLGFVDSLLESLVFFQDEFFYGVWNNLHSGEALIGAGDSSMRRSEAVVLIQSIKILSRKGYASSTSHNPSDVEMSDAEEFDSDIKYPKLDDNKPSYAKPPTMAPNTATAPRSSTSQYAAPNAAASRSSSVPVNGSSSSWNRPEGGVAVLPVASAGVGGPRKAPPPAVKPKPTFLANTGSSFNSSGSAPGLPPPPYRTAAAPGRVIAVALYDFEAVQDGDLGFTKGDVIEIIDKTNDVNAWWRGRLNGREGVFPGNYVKLE